MQTLVSRIRPVLQSTLRLQCLRPGVRLFQYAGSTGGPVAIHPNSPPFSPFSSLGWLARALRRRSVSRSIPMTARWHSGPPLGWVSPYQPHLPAWKGPGEDSRRTGQENLGITLHGLLLSDTVDGVIPSRLTVDLATPGTIDHRTYTRDGYQRLLRGVYARVPAIPAGDDYERRRIQFVWRATAALSLCAHKGAVLHGSSALQVLGVALPEALEDWDHIHVIVPDEKNRPARQGVVSHHARRPLVVWRRVAGLPVLHPVQHWLQLRGATDDQMIEVGDGFLRRQHPLLTLANVSDELRRCSGLAGVPQARRVFPLLAPRTDSLPETTTRLILVRAGLPQPLVNPEVRTSAGPAYFIDLAYLPERIAVEYDGGYHGDELQMRKDALRRRLLQDDGWLIIPVTAPDLHNPRPIVRSVETALLTRRGVRLFQYAG